MSDVKREKVLQGVKIFGALSGLIGLFVSMFPYVQLLDPSSQSEFVSTLSVIVLSIVTCVSWAMVFKDLWKRSKRKLSKNAVEEVDPEVTIQNQPSIEEDGEPILKDGQVRPKLSFHPVIHQDLTRKQKRFFIDEHHSLPWIVEGEVDVYVVYTIKAENKIHVFAYVRNGKPEPICVKSVVLVLSNEQGQEVIRQEFQMSSLGLLTAWTSRPWDFYFSQEQLMNGEDFSRYLQASCIQISCVDLQQHVNLKDPRLSESPVSLSDEQRLAITNYLENMPSIQTNELNFAGILGQFVDGQLATTILISNGTKQRIKLEQISLAFFDASGEEAAVALFKPVNLILEPQAVRPQIFYFPAESYRKEKADISSWSISPTESPQIKFL